MRNPATSFALASLLFLGASASAVLAQTSAPAPSIAGQRPHRMMHAPDPAKQLAHLTTTLNLTTDQQTQIKPLLEDRSQQLQALQADTTMARPDKMAKMKAINQNTHSKLDAILTDEQKKKFAEANKDQREKMQEHMQARKAAAAQNAPAAQ